MNRELMLHFNHHQQEYEREIKQLGFLKRLMRERREAREEKQARATLSKRPAAKGIVL